MAHLAQETLPRPSLERSESLMARPLYRLGPLSWEEGHRGLWYDKFCDAWSLENGVSLDKPGWIRTVCEKPAGNAPLLTEQARRILALSLARKGKSIALKTTAPFVTGMGLSHPVESGFLWHPTLGVPYLPGSATKGLVRAWAREEGADVDAPLGSPSRAGRVAMLDALPLRPVTLRPDVTTPHYAGWSESDPPGDWRSPRPAPYLTVAPGSVFLFSVLPATAADQAMVDITLEWLKQALEWLGAGGRAALGYGRFVPDSEAERELARIRAAQATSTPEGRWNDQLARKNELEILELVLKFLGREPLQDPERKAFVAAVRATGLVDLWRAGRKKDNRTTLGPSKLKERAGLLDGEPGG